MAATPLPKPTATLFYDGACPLCRREARLYQNARGAEALAFVDIAGEGFDAKDYGLDPVAVQRSLHARAQDGSVHTGIDAFALVWSHLPRYRALAQLTRTPVVRQVMQAGYAVFARLRPHLPGRRACRSCAAPPRPQAPS